MHTQHGNAGVDGVDIAVGHELCNGSAAALIDLAKLRHLPHDAIVGVQAAQIGDDLRHAGQNMVDLRFRVALAERQAQRAVRDLMRDLPRAPVNLHMPMP